MVRCAEADHRIQSSSSAVRDTVAESMKAPSRRTFTVSLYMGFSCMLFYLVELFVEFPRFASFLILFRTLSNPRLNPSSPESWDSCRAAFVFVRRCDWDAPLESRRPAQGATCWVQLLFAFLSSVCEPTDRQQRKGRP